MSHQKQGVKYKPKPSAIKHSVNESERPVLTSDGVGRDSVSDKGTVRVELKAQEEADGP